MTTMWVLLVVFIGGSVLTDPNMRSYDECERNAHHWIKTTDGPITYRCILVDIPQPHHAQEGEK